MRLYVVTRKDLGTVYAGVQAGHAVAEFLLKYPDTPWRNSYLIYLAVDNETELLKLIDRLKYRRKDWAYFKEPDLNHQITAIACLDNGRTFSRLKLLS
jgi:hypothetical protein